MNMLDKSKKRQGIILSYLSKIRVLDVEMIMQLDIDGLGKTGKRNILRVMQSLEDKGLVKSVRKEVKLFFLPDGKLTYLEHRLLMNRYLCKNGLVNVARIEPNVKVNGVEFRPDFMIPKVPDPKEAKDWKFFEVDRTQKKSVNIQKVKRYKELGLQFEIVCGMERAYMWKGYVYHVV